MKICPSCNASVSVLIHNLGTGKRFCHKCASIEAPSFMPGLVYTLEDVEFLWDCGIDPEVGNIEAHLKTLSEGT